MPWSEPKKLYFGVSRLALSIHRQPAQMPTGIHDHEFSELVLVTSGKGLHVFEAKAGAPPRIDAIDAGDVFVLHQPERHGYRASENLAVINVIYDIEALQLKTRIPPEWETCRRLFLGESPGEESFAERQLFLDQSEVTEAMAILERIEGEIASRRSGWREAAICHFLLLLIFLARRYRLTAEDSPEPEWLGAVTEYMEQHFDRPLQLKDLAAVVHTSPSSLSHSFKRAMGCSPIDYLLSLKVQRAAELLRDDSIDISAVAAAVGFSDSNYFARQFRARVGQSPRAYRAHYRILAGEARTQSSREDENPEAETL